MATRDPDGPVHGSADSAAQEKAALRALEEHWQHPGRRAELETALMDFWVALRHQVLR